ncbi:hypothetical protein [Brachyspira hyodysenteriae]|uniref:hypothetical protein n=1 Tax=Brachyspira hyodysenteriae TaxID=159 RepID=UPI0022CD796A|nr:hypothetical protein [Brachyspira hyodysenteriae]MCZ9993734.1 hypothetical protein [Brachyspira hyodysenteriae]
MAELEKFSALYGKIDYPADLLTIPFEVLEYRNRLGLSLQASLSLYAGYFI